MVRRLRLLLAAAVTVSLSLPDPAGAALPRNAPQKRVWRFPDDYPKCLADRLLAAFPQLRRPGTK